MEPYSNNLKTPQCATIYDEIVQLGPMIVNFEKKMAPETYWALQSSSKIASNLILESMSKPNVGSEWRYGVPVKRPFCFGKRPTLRVSYNRFQVVSNQDDKPDAPSINSRAVDDDDVTYLYTVDSSSSGRIVPEIDLSEEPETANLSLKKASNDVKPAASKGRKRKLTGNSNPRKRSNKEVVIQCHNCDLNLNLTQNGANMFLASCGHTFCKTCSQEVGTKWCSCGTKINILRKLYR